MATTGKGLFLAGVVSGGILVPVLLFSVGWIVTSGASNSAVKTAAQEAVVESLAPICVVQFSNARERNEQLIALKALSQWDRPDFVAKNGWATMPGDNTANSLVASECARRLAALER